MMNADLNRQWRRTIRDMSSPQVAEAMACLDPAGSPGRQHPMSATAAVRVLLWAIQSLPRREAPDERLRSLASQRTTSITSALARADLPDQVLSPVDADLHCANQALRELLGSSARPIVLGDPDHRDERTAKASSPTGTALSATDQSPAAYRIMHDLTIAYGLSVVIALLIWLVTIAVVAVLIAKRIPLTPADLMQGWARTAELLDDPTSLMLPVTTLIIGMLSIPILTGDGRSASLEDRGRQLFLNRVIHVASFTVAILSLLTMPRSLSAEVEFSTGNVISSVMIILFALVPPTLTGLVVDERLRSLHKAEKTIERIDALLSENQPTSGEPAHRSCLEKLERLFHRTLCMGFLIIFAATTLVILCFAFVCTHAISHSVKLTVTSPLLLLGIMLFFLAYSTRYTTRTRWSNEMHGDKPPHWAVYSLPPVLLSAPPSFLMCSPMVLTGHIPWFIISSIALIIFQTIFAAAFQHLLPTKETEHRKRFLVHQRTLNERTVETERVNLEDQGRTVSDLPRSEP